MRTKDSEPGKKRAAQVHAFHLKDDGQIPNSHLPLLIYEKTFAEPAEDLASDIEEVLADHHWTQSWRNGIYSYHHYHSTAHEVLAVFSGSALVQFGGEHGIRQQLRCGDVVVIPAGVAHKNLGASADFEVIGAYPRGQEWDMCYGNPGERPGADERIGRVPLPEMDPVFGAGGPLKQHWTSD